ncbi:sulfatase-like hydrolase/transferase [Gaiella sp.]|uniref:sulfatase-like hydrolase/transferase n=1 Tax=Gaiella sp. TaxID=2663207 RepID=UPI0032632DB8
MTVVEAHRPNVVIVVADDMGYGDLGLFNDGRSSTPHLNAIAAEGVCLAQHYSGSPVCAPSRAALLTGRYPHRTGAIDTLQGRGLDRIALSETTIADLFRSAGYRTGLVGKWHNGALDPRFHPNARGFEEFVGFCGGGSDYYDYALDIDGVEVEGDRRYLTDVFTEHADAFVRRHADEPFFLVVAYNAPHFPMQAPEEIVQRYTDAGETLGAALTYAMVEVMDAGIGRIDATLHELGLADDTIVLFTSDNGPYLGEVLGVSLDRFNYGWRGAKHYVFEGGIRVPAIVRWPGRVEPGRIEESMVHFTDWLPTLAAAAGIDVPKALDLDGSDVGGVLAGEESDVVEQRFWQCNRYAPRIEGNAAMRDGDWKLVRPSIDSLMKVTDGDRLVDKALNFRGQDAIKEVDRSPLPEFDPGDPPAPLLFDLETDPFEQNDLAASEPDRVLAMSAALEEWFASVEADRAGNVDDRLL